MGLCKCPKKKVTNLFCFEHRVNVCEHCLVENHPNVSVAGVDKCELFIHGLFSSSVDIHQDNRPSPATGKMRIVVCGKLPTSKMRITVAERFLTRTLTLSIGAGAIELAGARPPKFLTAGARGHNKIYGAPVKY